MRVKYFPTDFITGSSWKATKKGAWYKCDVYVICGPWLHFCQQNIFCDRTLGFRTTFKK